MAKKLQKNKRRVVASVLGLLMVMQQAVPVMAYTAPPVTNITNSDGRPLLPQLGEYNITPDMVNIAQKLGFRSFQDFQLAAGDVANFVMQYYNMGQWVDKSGVTHKYEIGPSIDTFIAAVQNQININGLVNTVREVNGAFQPGGQLIFVSPNGMVVGASGVLNVGSLSVITPTEDTFNRFISDIPKDVPLYGDVVNVTHPDGSTGTMQDYFGVKGEKTWDPSVFSIDGSQSVRLENGAMVMANTAASAAANIHHGTAMRLVNCSSQREVMYHATGAATRKHAATIIAYRRLSMPIICEVVAP